MVTYDTYQVKVQNILMDFAGIEVLHESEIARQAMEKYLNLYKSMLNLGLNARSAWRVDAVVSDNHKPAGYFLNIVNEEFDIACRLLALNPNLLQILPYQDFSVNNMVCYMIASNSMMRTIIHEVAHAYIAGSDLFKQDDEK